MSAMRLDVMPLNDEQKDMCRRTISGNTFYMLVADALANRQPLSCVRMGDGERILLEHCHKGEPNETIQPFTPLNKSWLTRQGCLDMPKADFVARLQRAATECDYFGPNIMGIQNQKWNVAALLLPRPLYLDNWFVRQWTTAMKSALYKEAKHILLIHRSSEAANVLKDSCRAIGVKVSHIPLNFWWQAGSVLELAKQSSASLVLLSAGPANKQLAPDIAKSGKVVLDIGNAAGEWLLKSGMEAQLDLTLGGGK